MNYMGWKMKNVRFSRNGIEFEPTKQELKIVLDDYAKQLGEKSKRIAELENQLKTFLEKWEWLDLEDVDNTLTESEQKIWEIMQKNQDLEKQVAEKETRIAELEDKDWYEGTIKQLEEQNERLIKERDSANDQNKRVLEKLDLIVRSNQDLEKQLAEKEKKFQKWVNGYFTSPTNQPVLTTSQHISQDKIDFAIEQLEKVKEKLEVLLKNTEKELNSITDFEFHNKIQGSMKGYMDSINIIDQQIQELRGQE